MDNNGKGKEIFANYRRGVIDNGKIGLISINYEDAEVGDCVDILIDCPDGSGRRYTERGILIGIVG